MESEKGSLNRIKILYAIMFFFTGAFVLGISFILGKSHEAILRNTIVSLVGAGTVIFMLIDAAGKGKDGFSYDNFYKRNRFFVIYMLMVVLSCLFSLVPNEFWPYMSLFVVMALFSNTQIGLVSGVFFVTLSVMLEETAGVGELLMYVLAGVVALALFTNLGEETQVGLPVFISLLMQAVLLMHKYSDTADIESNAESYHSADLPEHVRRLCHKEIQRHVYGDQRC